MGSDITKEKEVLTPGDSDRVSDWIRDVRRGDQNAFVVLAERYRPLIESLVTRFTHEEQAELNREDLRQEAMVVFYHSILTYDLEQAEVEFGLYAKICISNALISQLRAQKRHMAEQFAEPLNTVLVAHDPEDPTVRLLEQERLKALWTVIRTNLSDFENQVWQLYISGRTAREIASLVGRDEKSVTNGIYRIRKKLRGLLR
ncbi:MAG: sigma-70 family RNA polymerase sigma factor [Clostridia bacterium]|nr:sigma-70 family RNA polymerase sigma factor [Clostridia bacterium]